MPKVTVALGSNRPGGIDITLAGLCAQSFKDFEVVFVDGRYHQRHTQVLEAVERSGLKQAFIHVPNHRHSDGPWGSACAGYNTSFALAAGDLIVMLLDYAYARPDWLERHVEHEGKLTMSPHEYRTLTGARTKYGLAGPEFNPQTLAGMPLDTAIAMVRGVREWYDEISCWPAPFEPSRLDHYPVEQESIPPSQRTGPGEPYWFSTKNESFPRESIFAVNGMRELWDCGRGPGDPDLGYRLHWSGLEPYVTREAMVHCINPRVILPNVNIVAPESGKMPPPHDHRITVEQGNAMYEKIRAEQVPWVENPESLDELRARIWHWRALSQERDAVIPRRVISDLDYFGVREAAAE